MQMRGRERRYRLKYEWVGMVASGWPEVEVLWSSDRKLKTDLRQDMTEQFNESRAFFLEVVVVLILLIELYYAFRGKGM
jgi:hypothetical protein